MSDDRYKGRYLDYDPCPEGVVSWRFFPKKKGGKVGRADALQELFDCGMEGGLFVQFLHVPGEFPVDADNNMELIDPDTACKLLADWCRFNLYDQDGNKL